MLILTCLSLVSTFITFIKSESEIQLAVDVIKAAKDGIKATNDILVMSQSGNICLENNDCYPINILNNLCCIRNGVVGQCCNMFYYISLRPLVYFLYEF